MERFTRIVPLLKRNDPIINSLNMCSIELTNKMTNDLIDALNCNTFISKIVLHTNRLSVESCNKLFDLLITNPKLDHLEIVNNNIQDVSLKYLSEVLKKLPQTRSPINLSLRSNRFTYKGAEYLASALEANAPVCWLDLRYNPTISDRGVEALALALTNNTMLTGLDVIKCGCNEYGAAALSDSLIENHTLRTLLIQDELSLQAIHSLSILFSDPSCSLQALYLWHCSLNAQLLEVLCRHIKGNTSLTTLALSYNKIDDNSSIFLADMILRNKSLTKLHLGANLFTPTAAGYFGVALSKNNTLQFLDLSRNNLSSYGVWPIAISLMNNTVLRTIDLRYNHIDSSGAEIICELLSTNTSIYVMRLSGNIFDDTAIDFIAARLKMNTTLKDIELNNVQMGSGGFISLCNALKSNSTLERLSISSNHFTSQSLSSFAELMKKNTPLQVFEMSDCNIDDQGCTFIAEGIMSNSTLIELDISKNLINEQGALMILDAMQGNYSLMKLNVNENPFIDPDGSLVIPNKIADFLERNNYYQHNKLMKDMAALATDLAFL
ncbi:hypothetical protein M9Y10_025616 [Tritrichomonas musculus]|uniref:Leucine Rich Repeat family protein n=1 Tax=Tritrichomonas musculus TaxID=1915356 RepID=A0ABR2H981_9EUKA